MTVKKELIVTGKTVEDARKKAAAQLGVAEEELIVAVLEEGRKGFLGIGASDAKISVSYQVPGEDAALTFVRKLIEDMGLEGLTVAKKYFRLWKGLLQRLLLNSFISTASSAV